MEPAATAAIVIIGDEILSGHTRDTNSGWLAERLRARGVRLVRIETVPDEAAEIESTVRRIAARDAPTWLFLVGGLGPTPDDRTYGAVARALGVELDLRPEHVAWARERAAAWGLSGEAWADPERAEATRRMIRLPAGSEALLNPVGAALGCVAKLEATRVVCLPGVPKELYAMFEQSFEAKYLSSSRASEETRELELECAEAQLWDILTDLERSFPSVRLGSYPQGRRRILLRLRGPAADAARAFDRLAERTRAWRPQVPEPGETRTDAA